MPDLQFPTDRIVGTVEWSGSWTDERGPVLATGSVSVPDAVAVGLDDQAVTGTEAAGGGSWTVEIGQDVVDLRFLRALPATGIESLTLHPIDEATFDAVAHLAPGLRRLYLVGTGFSDAVLETVTKLTGLTYLQSFGNDFTEQGVQHLASLVNLNQLYLGEETLTATAFDFVDELPHLTRLGLQDVPITADELGRLRSRLPGIDIG